MNYRHAFHAGNFADLFKHALLLALLQRLGSTQPRLNVIDTHAGAGLYDLRGEAAQRSGEAQAGVGRLMAEVNPPAVFRPLIEAVRACNPSGRLELYPGSPWLAVRALEPGGSYVGCELRPDDHALLAQLFTDRRGGPALQLPLTDGYAEAARRLGRGGEPALLVIDPPFEQADDYARVADLIAARSDPARQPALIWTPLKDLETFDAFLGALEAARPSSLVAAQVRLRPLHDPMRMNGCAVVLADAPDLEAEALEAGRWIADRIGETGAQARVERLVGAAT